MKCPKKPKRKILPIPYEIEHFTYTIIDGDGSGKLNLVNSDNEDMIDCDYVYSLTEYAIQGLFKIIREWHPLSKITLRSGNNCFYFYVERNLTAGELEAQKRIVENRQKLLDEQYDREMKEYLELHHQWKLFKLEEAKRKYV